MPDYNLHSYKFEMYSGKHRICVSVPYNFFDDKITRLPYMHTHAKYEVICVSYHKTADTHRHKFIVIPPLYPHQTFHGDGSAAYATTFQFKIEKLNAGQIRKAVLPIFILESFLTLDKPIEFPDNFKGHERMDSIKNELKEKPAAYFEKVNSEFMMLMIDLARGIPTGQGSTSPPKRSLDETRLDIIDSFFNDNFMRLNCCRKDLAELLHVSERHISRIIKSDFNISFREMLFRIRMEKAGGMRGQSRVTAKCMAHNVGYASAAAFLMAYKKYWGHPYKAAD